MRPDRKSRKRLHMLVRDLRRALEGQLFNVEDQWAGVAVILADNRRESFASWKQAIGFAVGSDAVLVNDVRGHESVLGRIGLSAIEHIVVNPEGRVAFAADKPAARRRGQCSDDNNEQENPPIHSWLLPGIRPTVCPFSQSFLPVHPQRKLNLPGILGGADSAEVRRAHNQARTVEVRVIG